MFCAGVVLLFGLLIWFVFLTLVGFALDVLNLAVGVFWLFGIWVSVLVVFSVVF